MAYIEPNTSVTLFKNTKLSMSYENSLYFESADARDTYWGITTEVSRVNIPKVYYQRASRGVIRVEKKMSEIFDCDYMRFKNSSFEDKYFYAFVTRVEYVNNVTCAVHYVLDPLMTWMGDFTIPQCLVVRQHAERDRIGDSLTDEGMQCGEYLTKTESYFPAITDVNTDNIVISVADEGGNGSVQGGVYSANRTIVCSNSTDANAQIANLVSQNLADNIISMFMCPIEYTKYDTSIGYYKREFEFTKGNDNFDGYVPRNNKLFIYPYHKIVVANGNGDEQVYRPELWTETNEKIVVTVYASVNTGIQIVAVPQRYKGQGENWEESITLNDFPMCSWNYDSYAAWLAQYNAYYPQNYSLMENEQWAGTYKTMNSGAIGMMTNTVKGGIDSAASALKNPLTAALAPAAGAIGAAQSFVNSGVDFAGDMALNAANNSIDREKMARDSYTYGSVIPTTPQVTKGKATPAVNYAAKTGRAFKLYDKKIYAQQARIIDDYFTLYGYAMNKVMTPNLNARRLFTYVKTSGCNIAGAIPADDARQIETIFDTGVRFWKRLSYIGDYQSENTPNQT